MNEVIKFGQHKDQAVIDEESIEASLQLFDNCMRAAANNLNAALNFFWSLPDDRLLALLNSYGPEKVNAIFTAHAEKAAMVNALLAARGLDPVAVIGATRDITVNPATGLFEIVVPPGPAAPEEALPEEPPVVLEETVLPPEGFSE